MVGARELRAVRPQCGSLIVRRFLFHDKMFAAFSAPSLHHIAKGMADE
jgi:hypothetical protein